MLFNSISYLLFLPVAYLLFTVTGERGRWCALLAASLAFYAALNALHLLEVLGLVTVVTYGAGICIGQSASPTLKRALLWSGIAANALILVVMKYLPFLMENLRSLASLLAVPMSIPPMTALVSIGVSYYIFQAMSYLFDVYLELEPPERHLGYFALYLAFFPKLLQGPIERGGDLLPQLKERYEFNYANVRLGILLFAWGLFKKVVIADRLGMYVDTVYNNVHGFGGLSLLLATYGYAFQIYADFSSYTDMALGSALLFNIRLTQNFNRPYMATSVADFWRRWHISFSRWILDYIFKPLQMQWRGWSNWGTAAALLVAFLISGLWHGASWGFLVWGGLHGLYMACSVFYRPYQKKLHRALGLEKSWVLKTWQILVTFNLVCFAWIFFRASSLEDAIYVISHVASDVPGATSKLLLSQGRLELMALVVLIALSSIFGFQRSLAFLQSRNKILRHSVYYLFVVSIVLFGISESTGFIYTGF
ncbi:MBOAT family O-acyltransferase [Geomesophilobacter sediminis]|uniref:MBOAT family protein n=1 Tax=Geomesophilobacter sediminis TaxID=2798584 RepID=A0A8J7IVJ1_9BACT|nr:MBOAT family O-acyltransferase [Geomesophilobacter sediminis]MBJ6723167.1 MBOAT family protein [Geomesophilobacter sediminis]